MNMAGSDAAKIGILVKMALGLLDELGKIIILFKRALAYTRTYSPSTRETTCIAN